MPKGIWLIDLNTCVVVHASKDTRNAYIDHIYVQQTILYMWWIRKNKKPIKKTKQEDRQWSVATDKIERPCLVTCFCVWFSRAYTGARIKKIQWASFKNARAHLSLRARWWWWYCVLLCITKAHEQKKKVSIY